MDSGTPAADVASTARAIDLILGLKTVRRRGWLLRGLASERCESVGDHSFGLAALILALKPAIEATLDVSRCIEMALAHDLAEAVVGDITPRDADHARKDALESEAMTAAFAPDHPLYDAWRDYADHRSPESRFVHDVDKLDLVLQGVRYARDEALPTEEMVARARDKITHPLLLQLLAALDEAAGGTA